jgi:hypothetical protein
MTWIQDSVAQFKNSLKGGWLLALSTTMLMTEVRAGVQYY